MSKKEIAATNKKKAADTKKGKQFIVSPRRSKRLKDTGNKDHDNGFILRNHRQALGIWSADNAGPHHPDYVNEYLLA